MKPTILIIPLLFTSCAAWEPARLSARGQNVRMATAITATETETYMDLGSVNCSTDYHSNCDIDLRNQAGNLGADVLVIESRMPFACGYENRNTCQIISGRAFRKKIG